MTSMCATATICLLAISASVTACATAVDDYGGGTSSSTTTSGPPSNRSDSGTTGSDAGSTPPEGDDTGAPTDPPPAPLTYPSGPYGFTVGATFPNRTLQAMHDGAWTSLSMLDLYDPDGSRHINGVYLSAGAEWCSACRAEAPMLQSMWTSRYEAKGARIVTALVQNASSGPADEATVQRWIAAFAITYDVAADPTYSVLAATGGTVPIPYGYVIDPRTMRIVQITEGASSSPLVPGLDALLTKNGG
jgi:hypothetical protein